MKGRWRWDKETERLVPYDAPRSSEYHSVITDEMPETWHPIANKYYTSKAKFRDETRARGGTEVGNETIPAPRPFEGGDPTEAIKRAIEEHGKRR